MSPGTGDKQRSDGSGRASDLSEPGVLTNLPSTRPQRASARRARTSPRTAKPKAAKPKAAKPKTAELPPRPQEPHVPRQGFEAEEDITPGVSVQPPSGAELAASVAELVGELAQAGLSTGGRLLKDAFTRLPGI
jgi:hypothetical protein